MIIRKTFKYRLRPNRSKASLCASFAGACRWVFNRGLEQRGLAWEEEKRSITLYDQNKELTELKRQEETVWLKGVHSQILQQSLSDLDLAYQAFFRRLKAGEKPGYPKFRCRGDGDSFRYPQGVKVSGDEVYLPKIGWLRFRKSREIEGVIKQTTVIREGKNWYVCFSCEISLEEQASSPIESVIGIDVGLESYATVAHEGGIKEYANPRFLRSELKHLRYLSRQVSKKVKGSRNRSKARAKLQAFHAKVRARRQDFLHKLSSSLVKSHDKIVVETLKVSKMLQDAPRSLARSISDAGWRIFLQLIKYKCEHAGKVFEEGGEYLPSTQLCYRCRKRNPMTLADRWYSCSCGNEMPRDHNSAHLLRAVGMTG